MVVTFQAFEVVILDIPVQATQVAHLAPVAHCGPVMVWIAFTNVMVSLSPLRGFACRGAVSLLWVIAP